MTHTVGAGRRPIAAALALTTMATLLLELALTRIFSVVLFYHFAFVAISVALFGLGVGGILSYYLTSRRSSSWSMLGQLSLATAAMTVLTLAILLSLEGNLLKVVFLYFVSAMPFVPAGAVISLAISETIEGVHRMYFWDLLGAAAGCLALVPLLDLAGGPNTVLAAGVLYAGSGALWFLAGGRRRQAALSLAAALALVAAIGGNSRAKWLDVRYAKGVTLGQEVYSRWNSFSRVAVKPGPNGGEPSIVIDADASTVIPGFALSELGPPARAELLRNGPGLPYLIRPGAKTLIIGPGGGYDVVRALAGGSRDVTGVEINPIIIDRIMKDRFAGYSHRLYFRPDVRIRVEDGRSFVRRSAEKYQVIQMTLVDTWASTAAGAFALTENNLYTTEAFTEYLAHLTSDGLLAITRWEFDPPRESLRVVALAMEALGRLGVREPAGHLIIGREDAGKLAGYGARDTVIVKRTPFTGEEVATARAAMQAAGLPPVYLPGERVANAFTALIEAEDPRRFAKEYRYDITPVTDNRPFFFYTVRPKDLLKFAMEHESEDVKINIGVMMLFGLLGTSLAATAIILVLPPAVLGTRLPREPGAYRRLAYFFAIGVGFIMVEVGLIQKFVLFLGRPTYSLTVVVFSLLVSSGLGSYASRRVIGEDEGRLRAALWTVALVVAALGALAPALLDAGVGLPLEAKCVLSVLLLFPAGFVMGMPFPCGLRRLERLYPAAVRWAWAMNSASSVLGSVAAIFLAIHLGLVQTLLLGAACYVAAWASLGRPAPVRAPVARAVGA